jgi:MoxR-like ATPase
MQHAGALILLDEISFARAQSIAVLQSICEPSVHRGVMINETGTRIPVHPSVAFFCADNTNGYGDSSGNFTGTRDQNSAFIDRFSYTFEFNYLPPADEAKLIHKRTDLHLDAARVIVKFAGVAREKSKAGMLTQPPSLRQLFAWAAAVKCGIPVRSAFESAVVRKYPADCSSELLAVFAATVDVAKFKSFLGK